MANRAAALFQRAGECPDKPAIVFDGEAVSFAELAGMVRSAAGGLAALGVGQGSRAGILLPACPEFVVVQQALFALGAVITPINPLYRAGEIAHAVDACELGFLVTQAGALEAMPDCRIVTLDELADANAQPIAHLADVAPSDPAMLLLTSATTGKAKGVVLTAANLAANYDATPGWLGLKGDDVILCALPLYNTFGLNQCINAMLVCGATMVLLTRFDPAACIAAIARHHCTFLPAVPTMLQRLFDDPEAGALASLRLIMTGGAPVPAALLARILDKAPAARVLTGYGLTEATALVTLAEVMLGADGQVERGRTIGQVLDGIELSIRDDAGRECPPGTAGEICIRGPNVMAGYHRCPEETAAALAGGWLHSGDIGTIDADGYAFIVDRKKDVIIRGGQNIYPLEIEEALYSFGGVAEVAVIGRADDDLGEVPVAFLAFAPGGGAPASALLAHCREHLSPYKLPAAFHIRDELPKGPTGKILRRALRDECSA
jgi:long-chain acyl-CoA synthetase